MAKSRCPAVLGAACTVVAVWLAVSSMSTTADAAAVLDGGGDYDVPAEELQEYLTELESYLAHRAKRGRFCLGRDKGCPKVKNGNDFCCDGSQCSCNLFGQNCKCSPMGLFQRLG